MALAPFQYPPHVLGHPNRISKEEGTEMGQPDTQYSVHPTADLSINRGSESPCLVYEPQTVLAQCNALRNSIILA